ncbi:MAG: XdhC family protein [Terracidiphilus sp.]|jgi:xanthine/CO dehydrogenase XdhC/CoxF family maturation factor
MTDIERILPLWRELKAASADYVLATVVAVEGSSYRKPGACMLLAPDGRRAGTVSGGCLESDVARRAWWLTENGPVVQRYSSIEEDGDLPYGSGCGGVIHLLLERRPTAGPLLMALEQAFELRIPLAVATILEGPEIARRAFAGLPNIAVKNSEAGNGCNDLQSVADTALERRISIEGAAFIGGTETRAWADFRPARPGLWIFGAGDDAIPLLALAKEMGWFVSVSDGRSQLATRSRFSMADSVNVLRLNELAAHHFSQPPPALADLKPTDAALVLTHSFDQDAHALAALLSLNIPLTYIGVLGPQRRTRELLAEAARLLDLPANDAQIDRWLEQLHAPMGLDLGAESPETIALSVIAEIQQSLTAASALPLRQVRGASLTVPS